MRRLQVLVIALLLTAVCAVGLAETVAMIGAREFSSLSGTEGAIKSAQEGDTITLVSSVDLGNSSLTFDQAGITLDLNGQSIISNNTVTLIIKRDLIIKDSGKDGKIGTENKSAILIADDNITVTILGGIIESNEGAIKTTKANGTATKNVTVNIEGGTFKSKSSTYGAVVSFGDNSFNILNGDFTSKNNVFTISGSDAVSISGGSYTSTSASNNNIFSVASTDNNRVSITGGTFNKNITGYVAEGYLTINDNGTYTVRPPAAPIQWFYTWTAPNIYYFADENPIPNRTTQCTIPTIKREGESSYHAAEEWVKITWTITASDAADASTPDETIATVDENGLITFKAPGTVKVWLTMSEENGNPSKSANKTVNYKEAPVYIIDSNGSKTAYASIYAAFNGSADGDRIVLGADQSVANIGKITINADKAVTLDLNGHKISFKQNYAANAFGALFTIQKGTLNIVDTAETKGGIIASGTNARAFHMDGTANTEATEAVLSIGEGVNVSSASDCCITAFGKATVSTAGNLTSPSDFAIAGNGSDGYAGTVINVTGGSVTSSIVAIYQPQNGVLNISGGTITGATAVYQKSGTLNIMGGTLVGNGTKADYTYNGDGANATGDALVIDNCGYPGGAPEPVIAGGTFTSVNAEAVASYAYGNNEKETGFIEGGSFSSAVPEDFTTDGYAAFLNEDDGTYTVKQGYYVRFIAGEETENSGYWSEPDGDEKVYEQSIPVEANQTAIEMGDPTWPGHTFIGWILPNGDLFDPDAPITENIILTADWELNKYTLRFNYQNKDEEPTVVSVKDVAHFTKVLAVAPKNPERENYTFQGWQIDAEHPVTEETVVDGEREYFATWKGVDQIILFTDGFGNALKTDTKPYGTDLTADEFAAMAPAMTDEEKAALIEEKEKDGSNWTLEDDNLWTPAPPATDPVPVLKAMVYTLNWIKQHTVTFDPDNGTTIDPVVVNDGAMVAEPTEELKKEGHTFDSWTLNGEPYVFGTPVTGPLTLKVKWIINQFTVTFMDGEKVLSALTQMVDYGAKAAEPEKPTKDGTAFVGWFEDGSETAYSFDTPVKGGLTLKAHWNDNGLTATASNGEAEETLYFGSGKTVVMNVIASAQEGKLTYEWYRVTTEGDKLEAGTTSGEYLVMPKADTVYRCVVKDEIGNSRTVTYHLVLEERTIALKVGQKVILPDKGDEVKLEGSTCITATGMTLTAAGEGEANVIVLRNGNRIAEYSATVYADQGIALPASLANLNAAAFLGDTGVRFVTVTGDAVIAKNAFENSGLKQLTVTSETFRLPDEFAYDIQSGITVVCSENSELAAQLSGSAFADANITVVYPAE